MLLSYEGGPAGETEMYWTSRGEVVFEPGVNVYSVIHTPTRDYLQRGLTPANNPPR